MAKKIKEPKSPTIEELAEQQGRASIEQAPAPVVEPTPMTQEEKTQAVVKQNLSSLNASTNTAEALAEKQGKESLSNTPDFNRTQVQDALQGEYKSFAQWAIDTRKNAEAKLEEEKQEIEREQKAAAATGWAEFGAALANLVGVSEGDAVSQNYKSYSQDWMTKADADRRAHRNRIHDLRQQQIDTEMKMAQLRMQNGLQMAQYDAKQRQLAIENALAQRKAELDARFKAGELALKEYEAETKRLDAQIRADYNAGRLANETKRTNAQAAASYSTASYNKTREAQLKSGGGSGSEILVTLGEYGDEPEETLHIKPESLVSTIQANYKSLELSQEEQKAIQGIIRDPSKSADQKADELKSLLVTNSSLRNLVRKSSTKVEKHTKEEKPQTISGKSTQDLINGL
jgi:hypothetical protein